MMDEFALKCCRVCGSDIHIDTETCPMCSSSQRPEKKPFSTIIIIVFALLGFLCITLLGIMSAHAIQQVIYHRMNSSNEMALRNLSRAKIALDDYVAHHGRIPENLGEISYRSDEGVLIVLQKTSAKSYRLISSHDLGDREYFVSSKNNTMYYQKTRQSGAR